MATKKRDYKKEYQQQKKRIARDKCVHDARMERQRARRAMDKKGVNRSGFDIAHNKPLSKGGTNKDGYRLQSPSKNRSFRRKSDKSVA
jgi:hypothetical protein